MLSELPREIYATPRGEKMYFIQTGEDTGGTALVFEHFIDSGKGLSNPHVHVSQTEQYTVISGRATYQIDGVEKTAAAGESIVIPAGTTHVNPWNQGPDPLHLRRMTTPDGGAQLYFVTLFALVNEGWRVDPSIQEFNALQLAVIAMYIPHKTYVRHIPLWIQKVALPPLALIGWIVGYRPRYPHLEEKWFAKGLKP